MEIIGGRLVDNGVYPLAMTKNGILEAVNEDENLSIEALDDNGLVVWDDDGAKMIPFRFLEKMDAGHLAELIDISGDIPEQYRPDKRVLAEYLWEACDKNCFITLEKLAVIWSEPEDEATFEPADFEDELALRMHEEYGDEYAMEIRQGNLGQLWWERNVPVVNMGEVVRAAMAVAEENRDIVEIDSFFEEENQILMGLLTTVVHELRHLQMDTNIFLPEEDYPVGLAAEAAVEDYCRRVYEAHGIPFGLFPACPRHHSVADVLRKAEEKASAPFKQPEIADCVRRVCSK